MVIIPVAFVAPTALAKVTNLLAATWKTADDGLRGADYLVSSVCAPGGTIYGACLPLAGRVPKVWDNQECVGSAQAPRLWCVTGHNSSLCQSRGCESAPARYQPCVTIPVTS